MNNRNGNTSYRTRTSGALIGLLAGLLCQSLWAQGPDADYELSYFANAAHGELIADGRYRLAIHFLSGGGHDPIAKMTNRCVARTLLGEFQKARRDCNRAVELSEQAATEAAEKDEQELYRRWASALSNRGVLRAIREQRGAEEDFLQASEIRSATATRNLARFTQVDR